MLIVCFYFFSAIDLNDERAEEGEVSECQEEGDQGQAIKASHLLVAYLNPICHYALLYSCFHYYALFSYIAISLM
jgi:hypothetical protein